MSLQRIIFPWEHRRWQFIKDKLSTEIKSVVDLDSRIVSMHEGRIKSRMIIDIFNTYYNDSRYAPNRMPVEDFIGKILPMLCRLVIGGPKLFSGYVLRILSESSVAATNTTTNTTNPIPLTINDNICLTRPMVATLIACSWFGIFDYTYITRGRYKIEDLNDFSCIGIFRIRISLPFSVC